jgi:hypothetical protein
VVTLAAWCRERNAPETSTRRIYDRLFPNGARAGLYRLVTAEQSAVLERELRARGHLPAEAVNA